jgi:hypothetical protein
VRELAAISVLAEGGRVLGNKTIGKDREWQRRLKGRKRNNNGNKK